MVVANCELWEAVFSLRQHIAYMLSALYAIVRPSVHLFVCPSHGWISQKWLMLGL